MNALGFTLADHDKELGRARKLIERAHEAAPRNAAILDSLGWVLYRQGRSAEALPYLQAAYTDDRGGDIAAHLGRSVVETRPTRRCASNLGRRGNGRPRQCLLKSTQQRLTPHELVHASCVAFDRLRAIGRLLQRRSPAAAVRQAGTLGPPNCSTLNSWQLDGRAAVAFGTQGWQATLNWRQAGPFAEVHLAGPFGIGALVLKQGPDGISMNGAPPSDAVMSQLQDKLGFELPLQNLRYWLLGVPDPGAAFELSRNDQDRAKSLRQPGWRIDYDRYMRHCRTIYCPRAWS